jgi:nucleotide-binding universal stress UspA family protein
MKTIIAPVDFSEVSNNACLYAAKMAEDIQAKLVLLHVMELPVNVTEVPVSEKVFDEINMAEELNKLKEKLCNETNNKVQIETENIMGSVEYEIIDLCKHRKPFAVVMATHSDRILDRFFLGSTTLYSARHINFPVLVIPACTKYKPIKKVAFATDLKDIFDVPLHEIETIVKTFNAEFEILHNCQDQQDINWKSVPGSILDRRFVHLDPKFFFVENSDTTDGVMSLAKKHNIDILILVTKKHGPFHKSATRNFIFYAAVPLIVLHEEDVMVQS